MTIFEASIVVMLTGGSLSFVAFIFFRQPGVPLWFLGPVWRARVYVTPMGALLWKASSIVGLSGAALLLWAIFV